MKPGAISITGRYRLKELTLERSQAVTPGRVMWCQGRKVMGYGDVADLANVLKIPKGANTVCVSAADFEDIKGWLG